MKTRLIVALAGLLALPTLAAEPSPAAEPFMLVTLKPIHSLVAGVMEGIGEPALLVDGSASPHTFSLKPSSARLLRRATLLFEVDPELERFLARSLESLAPAAKVVALGPMSDDRAASADDDHALPPDASTDDSHANETELHAWLDPIRATRMVSVIADELAQVDPGNATRYRKNAGKLVMSLVDLASVIRTQLQPVQHVGFAVFHDAYGAFEDRFKLQQPLALTVNPSVSPGATTIARLRAELKGGEVRCLFTEPQFGITMLQRLVDGTNVKVGELDPLGATLEPGPALYATLLRALADNLTACLQAD